MNDRTTSILAALGEYGVLGFEELFAMFFAGKSAERCRQILAALIRSKLIRAIRLQYWYATQSLDNRYQGGRIPTLYVLGESGAEVVLQMTGKYPTRLCRCDPTPTTFFHRLHISRVRMGFDAAVKKLAFPVQWVHEQDIRPDVPKTAPPNKRRWLYHEFSTAKGRVTCQPDIAMRLSIPHPTAGMTELVVLAEIDLSREGHKQLKKKVPGYLEMVTHPSMPYWPDLQNAALRVFWITITERRMREMMKTMSAYPIADRFRFSTLDKCDENVLTAPVWENVAGEKMAIYRP